MGRGKTKDAYIQMKRLPETIDEFARPQGPQRLAIYAVGDVHGRVDLLQQTFTFIDEDIRQAQPEQTVQVLLGDYIDRGPASRETLDLLIERQRSNNIVLLRGNHEATLLHVLDTPDEAPNLRAFGLLATMRSYGVDTSLNPSRAEERKLVDQLRRVFPREHYELLQNLKSSYSCGDYFFVHAGVRPNVALEEQNENDMMWIREEFLDFTGDFGKYVVHGHTPVKSLDIRRNRMNIDTGAYATNNLTIVKFYESEVATATATTRTTTM